ncbi:kinase-like protein [Exidia glandulosa HHB12029]|uniref:Kinase-like protein n=1 Tax=Exidia glandulosa HHB12029 TaxID=1314781 RepID=A0A165NUP5_EXIGL|nr:kinase-like protein [Exidia glandulosa HHB12029]
MSQMLQREISVWQTLEHPNVQRLLGLCEGISDKVPAMVSEWYQHGDINEYLRPRRHDPKTGFQSLVYQLLTQVWSGLRYLHENSIVHADIKGANVLISDDHSVRLTDFGFSKLLVDSETKSVSEHSTLSGTCRWMAPEIVDDTSPHSKASDIWACGCLVLEVLSGQVPYHTKPTTTSVILALARKERPPRPEGIDDTYWRFSQSCCAILPEERPSIGEVQSRMRSCRGAI